MHPSICTPHSQSTGDQTVSFIIYNWKVNKFMRRLTEQVLNWGQNCKFYFQCPITMMIRSLDILVSFTSNRFKRLLVPHSLRHFFFHSASHTICVIYHYTTFHILELHIIHIPRMNLHLQIYGWINYYYKLSSNMHLTWFCEIPTCCRVFNSIFWLSTCE